ncbi:MAG: PAS domain S-box protein, partial [Aureliella sp.]
LASPQPIEDTIQTLDGRWFIRRVLAYSTADNQCDGLVVTFVDVTELRKSEKRLKAALHGGCVSAWEINLRTKEVWRTAGHDQLFGYAEDLPVWNLETFLQHVVPEQVEAVRQKFDQCMETFDDWSLECEIIRTDGQRRWLFARGLPAGDLHGNPTRMYGTIGDVTERKRSEHALTESEAHLRRIIDNMLGFVGVLDVSGVLLDANEAALQVGGVTREMVIGKPFWECDWWVHDPRQVQRLKASIEKARGGQAVRYDARVQTAGGGLIDIDFMLVPAHNDQGQITHLIPSAVDITPRKKALEALQESEAFNRSILESSGDCIKVLDLDGRLISINDSGLRALEVDDVAQIQGEPLTSLWPQEDHSVVVAAYEAAVAGGVGHFVGQCPTAKGTLKWWDVLITPILGDNGKPERLLSISRDITQSRTMEQAIQESEMRFQTLADHMAQLAWMADPSGNITWYNQRWFEYTGTTLEEVEGWGWERCHHPDHLQRVTVKFKHALDNGLLWEDTFPLRGKDGTYRWFLSRAMPIRDASGQIIRWFGTNTDISDRIRIEAELEEARRLAEAANQAKSDFLANMSHEIRTPMTAILGFAELLKVSDEAEGEKVETIRRNGQFLLELINDILDLSKIEAGKIEIDVLRFSPSKLVEDVCSLMHLRAVESNLDLKVEYVGLIPDVIENDPIRVRQILINLVGNAIKFTHEGSIRLRLSFSPEDRMLRFDVVDTGIG